MFQARIARILAILTMVLTMSVGIGMQQASAAAPTKVAAAKSVTTASLRQHAPLAAATPAKQAAVLAVMPVRMANGTFTWNKVGAFAGCIFGVGVPIGVGWAPEGVKQVETRLVTRSV